MSYKLLDVLRVRAIIVGFHGPNDSTGSSSLTHVVSAVRHPRFEIRQSLEFKRSSVSSSKQFEAVNSFEKPSMTIRSGCSLNLINSEIDFSIFKINFSGAFEAAPVFFHSLRQIPARLTSLGLKLELANRFHFDDIQLAMWQNRNDWSIEPSRIFPSDKLSSSEFSKQR